LLCKTGFALRFGWFKCVMTVGSMELNLPML